MRVGGGGEDGRELGGEEEEEERCYNCVIWRQGWMDGFSFLQGRRIRSMVVFPRLDLAGLLFFLFLFGFTLGVCRSGRYGGFSLSAVRKEGRLLVC